MSTVTPGWRARSCCSQRKAGVDNKSGYWPWNDIQEQDMWRAIFLASGIFLILLGSQLFFVDQLEIRRLRQVAPPANQAQVVNTPFQQASYQTPGGGVVTPQQKTVLITPGDWAPWSLVAIGAIVVIYTFTIPARRGRASE
ncbi:MAG: hypothetical protein ACR2NP_02215 [Pirellulaceae bacterium]